MIDTWPCCDQPIRAGWSCTPSVLEYGDGRQHSRIRYGDESWWHRMDFGPAERCTDCGVRLNGYHHTSSCAQEQCPRCTGQLLSCDCPR